MKKNATPYYNSPTSVLAEKVNIINEAIVKIGEISGEQLNYLDACEIKEMLLELKKCTIREIENRRA